MTAPWMKTFKQLALIPALAALFLATLMFVLPPSLVVSARPQEGNTSSTGLNAETSIVGDEATPAQKLNTVAMMTGTIQTLIDAANPGDTVEIPAGTYNEIVILNKSVTLHGNGNVVIDAPSGRVMIVTQTATIQNVTITGGDVSGTDENGGGILVTNNADLTLEDVTVTGNAAEEGGGIYAESGSILTLDNVEVLSNTAESGGGVFASASLFIDNSLIAFNQATARNGGGVRSLMQLTVNDTEFRNNMADDRGGAIQADGRAVIDDALFLNNIAQNDNGGALSSGDELFLSNSEFYNNHTGQRGGAVYMSGSSSVNSITNSFFGQNSADNDGAALALNASGGTVEHVTIADNTGLNSKAAITVYMGNITIRNTIMTNHNIGINQAPPSGNGSVTEDYNAYFGTTTRVNGTASGGTNSNADSISFVNANGNNFHLGFSPGAIDRGGNFGINVDFDGNSRPLGGAPDIGADEIDTNYAPVAALNLPSIVKINEPVVADAGDSFDVNTLDTLQYQFEFENGPTFPFSTNISAIHTYAITGTFVVTLTVSDSSNSDVVTKNVTINEEGNLQIFLPLVIK